MRTFRLSHRRTAAVAVLVGSLSAIVPTLSADASPGDQIAPVTATSATTYGQTFARADGDVAATYYLAGSRIQQNTSTATSAMNSRGSSVVFSPNGVLSSTGALINNNFDANCAGGAGTATDCGTSGTVTVAFARPVTNPTLHVSGLGGAQTYGTSQSPEYANFATYFNLTASSSSTAAANSATLGPLLGSPTNLQLSAGRVQTTGLRPSTSCDNNGTSGATSTAGCGSVRVTGTNLTSITLTLGLRNSGSAVDTSQTANTLTDAFLLSTTVPDVATPGTNFSCSANSVYAVGDTDFNIHQVDVNTGAETFVGHVNAASGSRLNGLAITADGRAAYTVNRNVSPGGPTTIYRLDPVTGASTAYSGPALSATQTGNALVAGAINPVNGIYYFGLVSAGDGLEIYGFNTNTNTPISGRIAHVPDVTNGGTDFAFDSLGRMLVLTTSGNGAATGNALGMTHNPLPATGDDATLSFDTSAYVPPTTDTFSGLAVGVPQGFLYASASSGGQSVLRQLSPSSGTSVASNTITYQGVPTDQVSDLASCTSPNSLQVQADITSRVDAGDQFTVNVTGGGLAVTQSGTTSGSTTGVQTDAGATAGPFATLAGARYTFTETAAAGADLADYVTTWRCVNLDSPGATLASGTGASGSVTFPTPTGSAGIPLACYFSNEPVAPSIAITKTADHTAYHVGETVTYTIKVTNDGNVPLTGVQISDPNRASCARTIGTLAAGASSTGTCTDTTPVISNSNTANVTGTDPNGGTVFAFSTVGVPVIRPALSLTRTASRSTVTAAGQTVLHTFTVKNSGDSTITGLSIDDTAVAPGGVANPISCTVTTLSAGDSTTCTGTYAVTQADIDHGGVADTAKATGSDQLGATVTSNASPQNVTATRTPGLSLLASATPTTVATKGSTVSYEFVVKNTGNVTVSDWSVSNVFDNAAVVAPQITCPTGDLTPNATKTCTATYSVTQDDLDEGSISATAHATGTAPTGSVDSNDSATSVTASTAASLSMTRTALPTTIAANGDTVTYSYTVKNTGGQTVHGLTIDDSFTAPASAPSVSCDDTDLAPNDSTSCSATYTATQADVNKGSIEDSAVARATTRQGNVASDSVPQTITIPAAPQLTLTSTPAPTAVSAVGQKVTYTFGVKNTGNVTVDGIAIDLALTAPADPTPTVTCLATTLAPNAPTSCTATYTVTQDDLDHRSIDISAVATGKDPNDADVQSPTKTSSVSVTASRALSFTATATPTSVDSVDQAVTVTYTVTNNGNQTVTDVDVSATAPGGAPLTVTCQAGAIAPTESKTCTAVYSTTQQDLDNGAVSITATATAVAPGDVTVGPKTSTISVPVTTIGGLRLAATSSPTSVNAAGQVITLTFTVRNTSNRTASGVSIAATAPDGSPLTVACAVTSIAPGDTITCTATYTVTQADIDAGTISVDASISGSSGSTPISASLATPVTVVVKRPSIAAALTGRLATDDGTSSVGDQVVWTVRVSNPGEITLHDLTVVDRAGAPGRCEVTDLAAGESTNCTLSSTTLTKRMIAAGTVTNVATVTAEGSSQQVTAKSTANVALDPGSDNDGGNAGGNGSTGSAGPSSGDGSDNGTAPSSSGSAPLVPGDAAGTPADTGVEHLPLLVWSGLLLVLAGMVSFAAGVRRRTA